MPASKRTKSGLLQGFVNPKGTSNFLIRAVWTPDACAIDSCININKLSDPDLPAQDRAATNDERNCVLIPLAANTLAAQLRRACSCIAEHIAAVAPSPSAVTRMTLNFKIDAMVCPRRRRPRPHRCHAPPIRRSPSPRPARASHLVRGSACRHSPATTRVGGVAGPEPALARKGRGRPGIGPQAPARHAGRDHCLRACGPAAGGGSLPSVTARWPRAGGACVRARTHARVRARARTGCGCCGASSSTCASRSPPYTPPAPPRASAETRSAAACAARGAILAGGGGPAGPAGGAGGA